MDNLNNCIIQTRYINISISPTMTRKLLQTRGSDTLMFSKCYQYWRNIKKFI